HYVWLDTTARSNHKLFVFLPGTGQNPSMFQLLQQAAARLGYHVIGLMYPTGGGLARACPTTPDPSACYENARLEIIDGIDRVALFSSVTDGIQAEAPSWVATHVTPTERYYGIAHDRDGFYRPIRAGWDSLGLAAFGPPAMPETSNPPYDGTHLLVTDLVPRPN